LTCRVTHNGETLITGTILSHSFTTNEQRGWLNISGYSKSGVLEDCYLPQSKSVKQVWNVGSTLYQITKDCCSIFGINVVVDNIVADDCNKPYTTPTNYSDDGNYPTVKDFLVELADKVNVIVSHMPNGDLLLTRTNVKGTFDSKVLVLVKPISVEQNITGSPASVVPSNSQETFDPKPIFHFNGHNVPATNMTLQFNGQRMFSDIYVVGQRTVTPTQFDAPVTDSVNAIGNNDSPTKNVYVKQRLASPEKYYPVRPVVYYLPNGDDNTPDEAARAKLGTDFQGMTLTIEMQGWELNGKLVRPNTLITVQEKDLFLYKSSKWFVNEVNFNGNEKGEWATLVCVIPECYSEESWQNVIDVFD
jgi:prophage tail gpP-like protein